MSNFQEYMQIRDKLKGLLGFDQPSKPVSSIDVDNLSSEDFGLLVLLGWKMDYDSSSTKYVLRPPMVDEAYPAFGEWLSFAEPDQTAVVNDTAVLLSSAQTTPTFAKYIFKEGAGGPVTFNVGTAAKAKTIWSIPVDSNETTRWGETPWIPIATALYGYLGIGEASANATVTKFLKTRVVY